MPDEPQYEPSNPRGKWASRRRLAIRLGTALLEDERVPQAMKDKALEHKDVTLDVLADAIEDFGLSYEFKILRLMEKLYWDMIRQGQFGPLFVPNTVDVNGQRILTPVGEIKQLMDDIYTPEFLDQFDEEGEPLDQDPVEG
jgi:hypothetical protein